MRLARPYTHSILRLKSLTAFGAVLLCVCGIAQGADKPLKELRRGNGPDVETLDPQKARSVSAGNVLRDLYEGLVGEGPDGRLEPAAASSWEISTDGLDYRFQLRPDARWSNGEAVTAEDFAFALKRALDPAQAAPTAQLLAPIAQVQAEAPLLLHIRLHQPTAYFLGLLAQPIAFPLHRPSLAVHGAQFARPGRLVGNGAYRLVSWTLQSQLLLERNPHYWNNAQTCIDRVAFVTTEDGNAELQRFRAGELDLTEQVPAASARQLLKAGDSRLRVAPYLGVYFYGLNLTRAPFKDAPALRRALSLAIDREVIANKLLGSGEQPAWAWVPPGVAGYTGAQPEWAAWPRERRLAEARRLYAQAGYSTQHPLRLEIRYNTDDQHEKIATVVAAMWRQFLGVQVQTVNEESRVFLQTRRAKQLTQVFRASWIADYDDAFGFLDLLLSRHGRNDTGYANADYDALIQSASADTQPRSRAVTLQQAEALLLQETPVIPLYWYVSKHMVSPRVRGWQGNLMDHHASRTLDLAP